MLSDFRRAFFNKYSEYSYEIQQKAYMFFWGSVWGFLCSFIFLIYASYAYHVTNDQVAMILAIYNAVFMIFLAISGYWSINVKYRLATFLVLFYFSMFILTGFLLSLGRFSETGILTHREVFYVLLAYLSIFHSKRIFSVGSALIIIVPVAVLLPKKPDLGPMANHYLDATLVNGTISYIFVSVLLYFGLSINRRSLDKAEKEISINKVLNENLDQKVKDRTKELADKNKLLVNIERNLKKYLPIQLVNTIKSGQTADAPDTERRKLTIFFSDIKDFTGVTDAMEPEDMAVLLNEYLSEMDEIINEFNGTLAQVTGDSLLVFFGAPDQTNEKDHALRCVKMAISMQKRMEALQKTWFDRGIDDTLAIRCGINTGMATVGNFGSTTRKLYTAHGMQVNIAARLEQACEPGGILISHTTWALVNGEVDCTDQGQIDVKGYHKPVRVHSIYTK